MKKKEFLAVIKVDKKIIKSIREGIKQIRNEVKSNRKTRSEKARQKTAVKN